MNHGSNKRKKKEKLVVEVIAANNLMPKDGEGSSSPFVEVEFENQRRRTAVKPKDLNPEWNQKLIFDVRDAAGLPYRALEVSVFNEKRSPSTRNFLGKVRISGAAIPKDPLDAHRSLYALEKRSLFSHVRGEITLKIYLSVSEEEEEEEEEDEEQTGKRNRKKKTCYAPSSSAAELEVRQTVAVVQESKQTPQQSYQHVETSESSNTGEVKPILITAGSAEQPVPGGGENDFSLKETSPHLGGGDLSRDKTSSTYDLVEQMQYLYVRVIKARGIAGLGQVVAEVKVGNCRGVTNPASSDNPVWDRVFAFSEESVQSPVLEIFVKGNNKAVDGQLGPVYRVCFDLNEVPKRVQPDSQLAPQWYRMESSAMGDSGGGEMMAAVWLGTQADEAFAEAWHSESAANVRCLDGLSTLNSKVYLSPKLWYLRVSVIEAHDVVLGEKAASVMRYPELSTKVQVGNQVLRTRISPVNAASGGFSHPYWNEDLMFVVAEPFEDYVLVSVEDRHAPGREEVVGRVWLPAEAVVKRTDEKPVGSSWFNLDAGFGSRIHLRLSFDGGYHVLDESALYCSDVRPTAKELWRPSIGVLEMGILEATGLVPTWIGKGGGGADAYCVAKYGQKWVRTRTVVDSLSPKWNEQYTWEVFDPCTVITVGVFDNWHVGNGGGARDPRIGKVRIRVSTLGSDRVYTHAYPLLMLHTSGVKKMGELHLALRFSCSNVANMLHMYTLPLLPKMHYVQPLSVNQLENLRHHAMNVVTARLSRAEPPLGSEVVEYMLDHDSHVWSMRKSKANFFRLMTILSGLAGAVRFVEAMRDWRRPAYSSMFVMLYLLLVAFPELIVPAVLLYMAFLGMWRYRASPRHPPHMDTRLSLAESVYADELDEEFDSFPTSRSADVVRVRYDRLRIVAGRIQTMVGDMATQGERLQALLGWRDPRATFLFVIVCLVGAAGFYLVPMRLAAGIWGLYALRPPRFRSKLPSQAVNFFRRLPAKADTML